VDWSARLRTAPERSLQLSLQLSLGRVPEQLSEVTVSVVGMSQDGTTQTSMGSDSPEPQPSSPEQTDQTTATEEQPAGAPGGAPGGPAGGSSAEKPTDQWATGDEPMTGPQASYLSTLAREAGQEVPDGLTKAQASDLIDELQGKSQRVDG
jgi:hypothetical protein